MCYILHSDWSLLLLVNTHGSFHCEQSIMLLAYKVVYTVNKAVYRKHYFTPSCSTYNRIYNFLSVHFPSTCISPHHSTLLLPPPLFFSLLHSSSPSSTLLLPPMSFYLSIPPTLLSQLTALASSAAASCLFNNSSRCWEICEDDDVNKNDMTSQRTV